VLAALSLKSHGIPALIFETITKINSVLILSDRKLPCGGVFMLYCALLSKEMPPMLSPFLPSTLRILIVDDEPQVRKFLRVTLQAENFNVLEAATAEDAITLVHTSAPDLMILDLGLPGIDGRQVIRDVRMKSDMPILVLSGRTEDSVKIAALEQGADDYMTKPFSMRDLVRRVRAALQQQMARQSDNVGSIITGELDIHLNDHGVTRGPLSINLDNDEYALLRLLALHGGRVLTFGHIERELLGKEGSPDDHRQVQLRVNALRRKLEAEPSFPRYIMTEPAVGYRLEILPPASR
jgi:two-component system KDP operon response regulator KdpE